MLAVLMDHMVLVQIIIEVKTLVKAQILILVPHQHLKALLPRVVVKEWGEIPQLVLKLMVILVVLVVVLLTDCLLYTSPSPRD